MMTKALYKIDRQLDKMTARQKDGQTEKARWIDIRNSKQDKEGRGRISEKNAYLLFMLYILKYVLYKQGQGVFFIAFIKKSKFLQFPKYVYNKLRYNF